MTVLAGETDQAAPGPARDTEGRRFADLGPRAVSGIVLIALGLGTAVLGDRPFELLWWAASLAIAWEWQRMVSRRGVGPRFLLGGAFVSLAASLAGARLIGLAVVALLAGGLLVAAMSEPGRRRWAGAGVAYAGALVVSVDLLRQSFPFGFEAIVWLFAVVWGTDIMAYVAGRLIGGPKLWPRLSPKKTWAGFLVGIGCGSLAGLAVAPVGGRYGAYVLLGLLVGAIAQGGDLFESAMKRRFAVKDSSRLIPGHGGVMDRLDGFVAAATFAALLGLARYGVDMPGAGLFSW